ncbi:MAG: WYL domain-containing protein [Treponema sp.]|jgi:predicted DNA-binding transcriptional regulator YafY|nr:WYL domain-containing protein [Treponema sp.]
MNTRKETPKTALSRIYFIDRRIASGAYPNTRQLAQEYETSPSTISRDIDFMRAQLDAPIVYDHQRNGYYYTEKTFRLPAGFVGDKDMLALGMAKTLLSLYRDTPLYECARELLDLITTPLVASLREGARKPEETPWYESRVVVPQVASAPVSPEVWEVIIHGLRENRLITFEYQGAWDEDYRSRRVRPYQLLFDNGAWYLYAHAEDRAAIRIFSIARMRQATLTATTFTLPPDYEYRAYTDSYFGVFAGAQSCRFRVAFYDEAIVWVQDRRWANDQYIEEIAQGIVITFSSTQYEKVLEWVLSQGGNAHPFEPPELVQDWKAAIASMAARAEEE